MKRITFLLAFIFFAGVAVAQKSVVFKVKFLPKHTYKMTNNMNMDMHMKVPDSMAKRANMPPNGMNIKLNGLQIVSIKTGAKTADGSFTYEMKYDSLATKISQNGVEKPIPIPAKTGMVITGVCTPQGKMHVDSIPNAKTDVATQKMILEMVNKMADRVKFPEKPMTVGESFTQDMPFELPIAGQGSQLNMKCIYKLTGIKGNEAYFDVAMSMDMSMINNKMPNGSMTLKGTGQGTGTMVYLIDKNFPSQHATNFDMHMNMLMANMTMQMDMKATYNIKTEISAN
jgi:hypothetical protein